MPNEFMPFVTLGAPKITDLKNEKNKPVKVHLDSSLLSSMGLLANSKEEVYKKAQFHLITKPSDFELDNLPLLLNSFINWYDTQTLPIKNEAFITAISNILKKEISVLVSSNEFKQSKEIITKTLILISIADKDVDFKRPVILRAFKFIAAFETLSILQTENPARAFKILLQRTILLPKIVFPVNFESAKYLEIIKDFEKKKAFSIAEEQKLINDKTEKLEQYNKAIDEIANTFDIHVSRLGEKTAKNPVPDPRLVRTSVVSLTPEVKLSYNSLDKKTVEEFLSKGTQDILEKEGFNLNFINVPASIDKLGNGYKKIFNDLADLKNRRTNSTAQDAQWDPTSLSVPGQCPLPNTPAILTPPEDFPPKKGNKIEHTYYLGMLQKVRQKLKRYELGEIAAIENVMIGETKIAKYRQFRKSEETVTNETETSQDSEKELQTNDQFQLQTQSTKTIAEDKSKEAGITITSNYGPVTTVTGNIAIHNASEESRNTSTNYAKDIINRSVQKIKERVFKQTIKKTTEETEKKQEHSFDNTKDGSEHINGVYQWVNKIYEVQVVNYGLRQFLEFIIPDPAAFYRFALQNKPTEGMTSEKPEKPGYCYRGVYSPLEPKDLNEFNYLYWSGKLNVPDVTPPPGRFKNVAFNKIFSSKASDKTPNVVLLENNTEATINIPKNYFVKSIEYNYDWAISSLKTTQDGDSTDQAYFSVLIANYVIFTKFLNQAAASDNPTLRATDGDYTNTPNSLSGASLSYIQNDQNEDLKIGVSATGFNTVACTINLGVILLCERSKESYEKWQLDTFSKIMTAYNDLLSQYNRELENRQFSVFTSIQGRNPFINREIEKTELKKSCLSQFTGQNYESFSFMMETDPITGYPQLNYENTFLGGKYIQFFENAFEWQNMTYIFYDYFWSNKIDWPGILSVKDIDPLFEKFLKAGSARVQIPVRLGFENSISNFLQFQSGSPWNGTSDAPLIEDDETTLPLISMLDEIKAQMNVDFDLAVGTINVEEGSAKVKGSGTNFTDDDKDREIIINSNSYRIASVEDEENIILRQPYKREKLEESTENIGYYLGVKFVGEPWEILVPTELLFLSDNQII